MSSESVRVYYKKRVEFDLEEVFSSILSFQGSIRRIFCTKKGRRNFYSLAFTPCQRASLGMFREENSLLGVSFEEGPFHPFAAVTVAVLVNTDGAVPLFCPTCGSRNSRRLKVPRDISGVDPVRIAEFLRKSSCKVQPDWPDLVLWNASASELKLEAFHW